MVRRAVLAVAGAAVALLVVVVGAAVALLVSAPGHSAVRRFALRSLREAVDGRVMIGSLGGPLWRAADLTDVELISPEDRPVIRIGRVRVGFALPDVLRGRFLLSRVTLDRPTVVLEQGGDGHWNVERLFRLLEPDTGAPARRPLVDLRDARIVDGTLVLRDSSGRVRRFLGINLDLARLRASHPDSAAIVAEIRRLAIRVSDPEITVVRAAGHAVLEGDSAHVNLERLELPGSSASLVARARWDGPALALEISLHAQRLSFADLAWLSPGLPRAGGGRLVLRGRMLATGGSEWDVRDADLSSGRSSVGGSIRLAVGAGGGLKIGAMDLVLKPLDLALVRPFLDTLPLAGTVRGRLRGAGALRDVLVDASVTFADELVAGRPANRIVGRGHLALGGSETLVFRGFTVSPADLSLATIQRFAPAVTLHGRLRAAGTLDGAWTDATFRGVLAHGDGPGPISAFRGTTRLTLADTVRLDADVVADSVSFDLLARSYAAIPLHGAAAGPIRVVGPLAALAVDGSLSGPSGRVEAHGVVGALDSAVTVRVSGSLDAVDLASQVAGAPPTALGGRWSTDLVIPLAGDSGARARAGGSPAVTTGAFSLTLARSSVAGVTLSGAGLTIALSRDRIRIDTAYAAQQDAALDAVGALGRAGRPPGQIAFTIRVDSLDAFAPLVRWWRGATRDSLAGGADLAGSGHLSGRVVGTTADFDVRAELNMPAVRVGSFSSRAVHVEGGTRRASAVLSLFARAAAESLEVAGLRYGDVTVTASGSLDSLGVVLSAGFPLGASARAGARLRLDSGSVQVRLDSAAVVLPTRTWSLLTPVDFVLGTDSLAIDSLEFRGGTGGVLRVAGSLPLRGVGDLVLVADSVPLADLYALAERDTTGIGGALGGTARVAGAAGSPAIEAYIALTEGRFGDFRAPLLEALMWYVDRRLTFKGGLSREGERVLSIGGSLPLDLAFTGVAKRQLPGELEIRIEADSADLSAVDAVTSLVRDVSGQLVAAVDVRGTWEQPRLTGRAAVIDAAASVPALGARYSGISVQLGLDSNRIRVEQGRLRSGGTLDVTGEVVLEGLARPMLRLALDARGFAAMNERDFAGLTGTGRLALEGPFLGATLSGRLTVDAGFLVFADLVEKRIVNLDDPEFRAVVDSNLARAAGLGPSIENVFLDSLRIEGLTVAMGPDVWLRSHEANIQLAGEFTVAKTVESSASRYRLDGALRAVRGTYRLVVGPTSKEFQVTRGDVRFFGTPDLNPQLDIVATHTIRAVRGNDLVVRARIGGTLVEPRLALESDERPPLSETEIVSYLLFGRPSFDLVAAGSGSQSEQAVFQGALAGLAGVVSGELEQTLVADLGLPLDFLTIRPGGGTLGDVFGRSRVEAGTQIGERTFLTLNAGLCEVRRGNTSQLLGASVEYRLSRRWTFEASVEPVIQECRATGAAPRPTSPYQVGLDLFWQWGIQ